MAHLKITPDMAAKFMAARKLSTLARKAERKSLMKQIRSLYPAISRSSRIKVAVENKLNPLWLVLKDKKTGVPFCDGQPDLTPAQIKAAAKASAKAAADAVKAKAAKLRTDALAAIAAADAASAELETAELELAALDVPEELPAPPAEVVLPKAVSDLVEAVKDVTPAAPKAKKTVPVKAKPVTKAPIATKTPSAASKAKAAPLAKAPATKLAKGAKSLVAPAVSAKALSKQVAKSSTAAKPGYPKDVRIQLNGKRVRLGKATSAADEKRMISEAKAKAA